MNNDELLGIVDSLENLCGVVLLIYSAGRAVDNALAAGDARHGIERSLERRADVGVKSAGVCADNGDVLSLTCCDAATAILASVCVDDIIEGDYYKLAGKQKPVKPYHPTM